MEAERELGDIWGLGVLPTRHAAVGLGWWLQGEKSGKDMKARKACRNDVLHGFTDLTPEDVEKIFRMCL